MLLWLVFIPYFTFALVWAARLFPGRNGPATLASALPLFLALLLVGVAVPGNWLGEIRAPFLISGGLCLAGTAAAWLRGKRPHFGAWPRPGREDLPWMMVLAAATLLVTVVSLRYAIFDEVRLQGHIPVVEAMLRGHFPPSYIAFPEVSFRYHYGFNVIAALFSLASGAKAPAGIDVAALLCWVSLAASLLLLFSELGLPRRAWALAFCFVVLSGGMSWWLVARHDGWAGSLYQLPNWQQMFIYGRVIHPSFIMYFFQHPVSLGLVFFLGMLQCFRAWSEEGNRGAYWTGVFLLGAMSLAQVMLFLTALAALGGVFFWRFFRPGVPRRQNFLAGIGVLLGALATAFALGGFFRWGPGAESQPLHFTWPPGYLRNEFYGHGKPLSLFQALTWYFSGFGLALVLIPWAWWRSLRAEWSFALRFLLVFGVLAWTIPHFFQYAYSWDIVKWFFAFEFSGRILAAWAFWPWVGQSAGRQVLAWAFVLFGMVTPLRFLGELSFRPQASFNRAELRIAGYRQPRWTGAFAALVERLLAQPDNYGAVWSSASTSVPLAMATGFPMLQLDGNTVAMPVGRERIARRQELLKALNERPSRATLAEQGVRWVIFSCGEVKALPPAVKNFLQDLEYDPSVEKLSQNDGPRDCFQAYRLR